jgi:hypothetical protein
VYSTPNIHTRQERGFLDVLRDLMADSNPMVVANAVAALSEISEFTSSPMLVLNQHTLYKLLAALNECSEWGQVRAPERRVFFLWAEAQGPHSRAMPPCSETSESCGSPREAQKHIEENPSPVQTYATSFCRVHALGTGRAWGWKRERGARAVDTGWPIQWHAFQAV